MARFLSQCKGLRRHIYFLNLNLIKWIYLFIWFVLILLFKRQIFNSFIVYICGQQNPTRQQSSNDPFSPRDPNFLNFFPSVLQFKGSFIHNHLMSIDSAPKPTPINTIPISSIDTATDLGLLQIYAIVLGYFVGCEGVIIENSYCVSTPTCYKLRGFGGRTWYLPHKLILEIIENSFVAFLEPPNYYLVVLEPYHKSFVLFVEAKWWNSGFVLAVHIGVKCL